MKYYSYINGFPVRSVLLCSRESSVSNPFQSSSKKIGSEKISSLNLTFYEKKISCHQDKLSDRVTAISSKKNKVSCTVPIPIVEIKSKSFNACLIVAPDAFTLDILLNEHIPNTYFIRPNLKVICEEQCDLNSSRSHTVVTRLNCRVIGSSHQMLESLSLYGNDILRSDEFRDLIKINTATSRQSFFKRIEMNEEADQIWVVPNSVRLTYDPGDSTSMGANFDKFGNISYYYKHETFIKGLFKIFLYLDRLGSLEFVEYPPNKRSVESIRRISDVAGA